MYFIIAIFVAVLALLFLKIYNKITTGWCNSQVCLVGKTVLITGANSGIGYETALDLAKRGARVILACRNVDKAIETRNKIVKETRNNNIIAKQVDLSSFQSVRIFAHEVITNEERLDVLINNAGQGGPADKKTVDGLLEVMQVNYFAPFLLTYLLLGLLMKTPSSRIVNVSSVVAKYGSVDVNDINKYEGDAGLYVRSKVCLNLFTVELASKLTNSNVTVYSLHPGVVRTEIMRKMPYLMRTIANFIIETFCKTAIEGAQTSIYLAVANGIEDFSGQHFHDCHLVERYASCSDTKLAKELWKKTEEIVNVNFK